MKRLLVLAISPILVVGCSSNSTSESGDTTIAVESTSPTVANSVVIDLVVGESTGTEVSHTVALGSTVTISILNESEDDDYHLHGYDVSSGEVPSGETATMEFVADEAGSFELESHNSGDLLMTLVVE
jgi:uncharacterized protein YcfL